MTALVEAMIRCAATQLVRSFPLWGTWALFEASSRLAYVETLIRFNYEDALDSYRKMQS